MKRFLFRSAAALLGVGITAGALVACDDKNDPIVPPPGTLDVTLSSVQPTSSSVTFIVTPVGAESVAWLLLPADDALPSPEAVLRDGKQVSATVPTPVEEDHLNPETSYCLVAAAAAGERTVLSEPQRFTTLSGEEPQPEAVVLDRLVRATYYGVNEDAGFAANYYIQIADVECTQDQFGYWRPTGKGTLLNIDFWGDESTSAGIELPDGTYKIDGVHDPLTINPYNTGIEVLDGTEPKITAFDAGTVEVKTTGGVCSIRAHLTDAEGNRYEYEFSGPVVWEEYVPPVYDPITQDVETTFIGGDGIYYGDRDENGLGAFELYFYDVPLRDGFLSRAGNLLIMHILAPIEKVDDEFRIPEGTYTLDGQAGGAYRFLPGYVAEDMWYPDGSCCEQDDREGNPSYAIVTGGSMQISRSGDGYTATFDLATAERITVKGTFTGKIPMEDRVGWRPGGGGFSTLHRDITVDLSGIERGTLTYLGDYMRVGCASYIMDISADGWREAMQIEVLCEPDSDTDIGHGHYTVLPMGQPWDSFVPWSVIAGFLRESQSTGTWYFHMDEQGEVDSGGPMNGGTLDISKKDDLYTVEFAFEDDCTEPNKVSGRWTGRLDFVSTPFSVPVPASVAAPDIPSARRRVPSGR